MKVAFQIDKLDKLNFKGDSSYMLMEEAFKRGISLYFYHPETLSWQDNKVFATLYLVENIFGLEQMPNDNIPIIYKNLGVQELGDLNFIFLRQDPPFDMAYITSTFLLEKLMPKVKVINNPKHVRNSPEKLLVTEFSHLMPKTLISKDFNTIWEFLKKHKKCVIKPLYGNAGADVFFLELGDFNAKSIIEYFLYTFREQVMVQEFLENVKLGDKRIILIDGEAKGVFARIPAENEIKSNLAAGGSAKGCDLTEREHFICSEISQTLKDLDLFFVGIDVIDGFLTEINVTSPTGLRAMVNLGGENLSGYIWDRLLDKYKI